MDKKLFVLIVNLMMFWVFIDVMPGIEAAKNNTNLFISGVFYGLIIVFLSDILKFFKFPENFWAKLIIGGLLTIILLFALKSIGMLKIQSAVLGSADFLIFSIPRIARLTSDFAVVMVSTLLLSLCSIILAKLSKIES